MILDGDQIVRRLNRAAMLEMGHSYSEILGKRLSAIPGEPWLSGVMILRGMGDANSPLVCQARDPSSGRTLDLVANRLARNDGAEGSVIIAREITNIIALQDSLRTARRWPPWER